MVRARVREASELFPRRREIDFPLAERSSHVFMREVADVHRDLFAEFADSYGDNVRTKVERCLAVTDAEYERGVGAREEYPRAGRGALERLDLVLTPTLGFVAPPLPVDDLEIREATIRLTIPFNALGWPALALPCGPAEDGLPASLQIAGPPGSDALVLAVGELVESLVRSRLAVSRRLPGCRDDRLPRGLRIVIPQQLPSSDEAREPHVAESPLGAHRVRSTFSQRRPVSACQCPGTESFVGSARRVNRPSGRLRVDAIVDAQLGARPCPVEDIFEKRNADRAP